MKYTLKVWGQSQDKFSCVNPPDKEHDGALYWFFDSISSAKEIREKISHWKDGVLVSDFNEVKDDALWKKRTIACMDLVYEGKEYYHEQDFGYSYPASAAEFMYYEGNYSCDCNKSSFLAETYSDLEDIETEVCGDEIEVKNFCIYYRD